MANQSAQLKAEYMKQRKRVQGLVRRAKKQGLTVPENFVPAIPKRITQGSINRLAKLTPEKLYTKSTIEVVKKDNQGNSFKQTITGTEYKQTKKKKSTPKKKATSNTKKNTNSPKKATQRKAQTSAKAPKQKEKETEQEVERELTIEERYAEVQEAIDRNTVPDWLTDDLAQTYGYSTANDMWADSWEDESTRRTVEILDNIFANQAKKAPASYTQSDTEFQKNYTPRDLSNDDEFQEDEIVLNRVKDLIGNYGESLGGNLLNKVLTNSIEKYGENAVAGTLAAMEDQNPALLTEIQNLMFYPQRGHNSGAAGRAFKALADAIRMFDSDDEGAFNKALGDAMEALQYYDDIR